MGRMAIILVMGFAVMLAYASRSVTSRVSEAVENSTSYYDKTMAKDIASSASEIYVRKLKLGDASSNHSYTISSIMGGNAQVKIDSVDKNASAKPDSSLMTSIGIFLDQRDTVINLVAGNIAVNPPPVSGSVGVSYGTKAGIKAGSGDTISGYNHDLTGKLDTNTCASVDGITYGNMYDTTYSGLTGAKVTGKANITPDLVYNPSQP